MIRVEAKNFRSYPFFEWVVPSGLTLLDGVNLDTGGSNMAGKSTAIDALFWCRYGWLPKWGGPKGGSADGVIRRKDGEPVGGCFVRVTEQIGSDTIVVERSRPSKLVVYKNGEELKGINQDSLDQLLGMSAERYLICVYLSQNRHSSFYWMSDSDRAELLSVIANLEGLDRGLEQAKEQKTLAQNEISRTTGVLSVLEPRMLEFPETRKKISKEIETITEQENDAQEKVSFLSREYEEITPLLKEKKQRETESSTAPIQSEINSLRHGIPFLNKEILELNVSIQQQTQRIEPEYQKAVDDAIAVIKEIQSKEKEAQRISLENKRLQNLIVQETSLAEASFAGKCNHCGQDLSADKRQEQAMSHIRRAQEYQAQIRTVPSVPNLDLFQKEYETAIERMSSRKAELESQPKALQQKVLTLLETKKAAESKIRELEKEILLIESRIQSQIVEELKEKKAELDTASLSLSRIKDEKSRLLLLQADNDRSEKKAIDQVFQETQALKRSEFKLNQALDLIDFFGPRGYRVIAFDGLVRRISDRAGELLSLMTDSLYSTRLESVGQDSKGNQKLILKPIIIKGGIEVPKDDLSGGAETRVALAYDVAIAEAAGSGQPLFLDEVLEGMDSIGKSEAMILLEEVSKTRPVIVIDHTSEFKAQFSQVVRVVYQAGESRLEV